jgi:hypothetical protein
MADAPALTVTRVHAAVQVEGVHCWLAAPDEVKYLRMPHRHVFHVKAVACVEHDDRDVEFIMLGHRIKTWLKNQYPKYGKAHADETVDFQYASCEHIAKALLFAFDLYSCEVSEDGENGAIVTRA